MSKKKAKKDEQAKFNAVCEKLNKLCYGVKLAGDEDQYTLSYRIEPGGQWHQQVGDDLPALFGTAVKHVVG